ncbi:MAG: thiaminase II [Bordetella sp.]|nr:MAG: thiaminase II [Bordetella sp.]
MTFSADAWIRNIQLFETMCNMPFNKELANGRLRQETFKYYILQDSHYLISLSRTLAIVAAKAENTDEIVQFLEASKSAILLEYSLHKIFLKELKINENEVSDIPISSACHHYSHFLISTAFSASYPIIIAALLPCFWIYSEIGLHIYKNAKKTNPYMKWIKTYAGKEFQLIVKFIIQIIDKIGKNCDKSTINQMHAAYNDSMKLEWIFWNSAYNHESWNI